MSKLLEVKNLRTYFFTRKGTVKAVDDVSFDLKPGEIMGLVGESGAGKSITGFSMINLIDSPGKIVDGEINYLGKNILEFNEDEMNKIRGNDISMIFQDPQTSLNPVLTVERQLVETIAYHNKDLSKEEMRKRAIDMLNKVGIPSPEKRIKNYPHQFSGGMKQRIVISMALINNPKLLIADEPTTALDVTIQAQILFLMKKLCNDFKSSLILITHDIGVVAQLCDKVAVMYAGKIVEYGSKRDILYNPVHPYTKGLIECLPKLNEERKKLYQIKGIMPSLLNLPKGCYFRDRCPYADEECLVYPENKTVKGRVVACHKAENF